MSSHWCYDAAFSYEFPEIESIRTVIYEGDKRLIVSGCFLLLGNGEDSPCEQPLHAADYGFNDPPLPIGANFWPQLVRDHLPKQNPIE